jgi:hypothetical protein
MTDSTNDILLRIEEALLELINEEKSANKEAKEWREKTLKEHEEEVKTTFLKSQESVNNLINMGKKFTGELDEEREEFRRKIKGNKD